MARRRRVYYTDVANLRVCDYLTDATPDNVMTFATYPAAAQALANLINDEARAEHWAIIEEKNAAMQVFADRLNQVRTRQAERIAQVRANHERDCPQEGG